MHGSAANKCGEIFSPQSTQIPYVPLPMRRSAAAASCNRASSGESDTAACSFCNIARIDFNSVLVISTHCFLVQNSSHVKFRTEPHCGWHGRGPLCPLRSSGYPYGQIQVWFVVEFLFAGRAAEEKRLPFIFRPPGSRCRFDCHSADRI